MSAKLLVKVTSQQDPDLAAFTLMTREEFDGRWGLELDEACEAGGFDYEIVTDFMPLPHIIDDFIRP